MFGSITEAEDIVQEAWLRWYRADRSAVRDPAGYLSAGGFWMAIWHPFLTERLARWHLGKMV